MENETKTRKPRRLVKRMPSKHFLDWIEEAFKNNQFGEVLESTLSGDKYFKASFLHGYSQAGFATPSKLWKCYSPCRGFISFEKVKEALKAKDEKDERHKNKKIAFLREREERRAFVAIREEERKRKLAEKRALDDALRAERKAEKDRIRQEKEERKKNRKARKNAFRSVKVEIFEEF